MKLSLVLPLLTAGVLACPNAQLPRYQIDALLGRAIDPSTMDPVRLSVLEVLKTAIPSASDMVLPTGNVEPDWYKNLPQDVKNLLPSLYPVTTKAAAATPTSVMVYASASPSASSGTSSSATSPVPSTSEASNMYNIPSSTASNSSSAATSGPANVTLPTGSTPLAPPLASRTFSTGTKNAIRMETLTALMWLGAGAGFMIFA